MRDTFGNILPRSYYNEEIIKTRFKDVFLVESIIKSKGNMRLIKWLGYDDATWIHKNDIILPENND